MGCDRVRIICRIQSNVQQGTLASSLQSVLIGIGAGGIVKRSPRSILSGSLKGYFASLVDAAIGECERVFLRLTEQAPGAVLLDLGCDTGEWTSTVGKSIGAGQICGVDMVQVRIRLSSQTRKESMP
jgi:hypothetical protein